MSILATVNTDHGKVELHHESGVFTTRRIVRGIEAEILSGHTSYVSTLVLTAERAQWWWELADSEGHVYQPFPQPEAATTERAS